MIDLLVMIMYIGMKEDKATNDVDRQEYNRFDSDLGVVWCVDISIHPRIQHVFISSQALEYGLSWLM